MCNNITGDLPNLQKSEKVLQENSKFKLRPERYIGITPAMVIQKHKQTEK
jgi:hypothetical protein